MMQDAFVIGDEESGRTGRKAGDIPPFEGPRAPAAERRVPCSSP